MKDQKWLIFYVQILQIVNLIYIKNVSAVENCTCAHGKWEERTAGCWSWMVFNLLQFKETNYKHDCIHTQWIQKAPSIIFTKKMYKQQNGTTSCFIWSNGDETFHTCTTSYNIKPATKKKCWAATQVHTLHMLTRNFPLVLFCLTYFQCKAIFHLEGRIVAAILETAQSVC